MDYIYVWEIRMTKCSKCGKKIKGTVAIQNGKYVCQLCWKTKRARNSGSIYTFWRKWVEEK